MNNLASLKVIRDELATLTNKELITIISSLIRFRKENKELITYLLFDSKDEAEYIKSIKAETTDAMEPVTRYNVRPHLKLIRKTLRKIKKAIKISGNDETAVQLLLHFCAIMKEKNLPFTRFKGLNLVWERCLKDITKHLLLLHEDLRYDYTQELKGLLEI